jgi:hypothetical protein
VSAPRLGLLRSYTVSRFVAACCRRSNNHNDRITVAALAAAFRDWCAFTGVTSREGAQLTTIAFSRLVRSHLFHFGIIPITCRMHGRLHRAFRQITLKNLEEVSKCPTTPPGTTS